MENYKIGYDFGEKEISIEAYDFVDYCVTKIRKFNKGVLVSEEIIHERISDSTKQLTDDEKSNMVNS